MMLVQVTSRVLLRDPENGQEVSFRRPHVVQSTSFMHARAAFGQVKILANDLKDGATDAEFAKFWADSDKKADLAVESFLATFGPTADPVEQKPQTKAEKLAAAKAVKEAAEKAAKEAVEKAAAESK